MKEICQNRNCCLKSGCKLFSFYKPSNDNIVCSIYVPFKDKDGIDKCEMYTDKFMSSKEAKKGV